MATILTTNRVSVTVVNTTAPDKQQVLHEDVSGEVSATAEAGTKTIHASDKAWLVKYGLVS